MCRIRIILLILFLLPSIICGEYRKGKVLSSGSSIVAQWHYEEQSGVVAYDTSGNSKDATIANALHVESYIGHGLDYNGTNAKTTVSNPGMTQITSGEFSISFWIYLDAVGQTHSVISENSGGKHVGNVDIWVTNSDVVYFRMSNGTTNYNLYANDTVLSVSTWYHVVCTWENPTMRIYVNGIADSNTINTGAVTPFSGNFDFRTGSNVPGYENWLDGKIEEVRIDSRTMRAGEVLRTYRILQYNEQ